MTRDNDNLFSWLANKNFLPEFLGLNGGEPIMVCLADSKLCYVTLFYSFL